MNKLLSKDIPQDIPFEKKFDIYSKYMNPGKSKYITIREIEVANKKKL